jgi:DNA-binding NarL/FixJ family response regulator
MTAIRVGLADDQPLFRAGIRMIIDSQDDFEVAWEASDGREAVQFAASDPVDIVLMDLEMPVMEGVKATALVLANRASPGQIEDRDDELEPRPTRVVVLTTFELNDRTFAAIQAGASGFLLKNADPEFLLASLRTVHAGTAVIAPSVTTGLVHRFARAPQSVVAGSLGELTAREKEIFLSIASGLSNSEIATHHHVSDATVKTHVSRILTKLALRDRVQLVIYAYENGLVGETH